MKQPSCRLLALFLCLCAVSSCVRSSRPNAAGSAKPAAAGSPAAAPPAERPQPTSIRAAPQPPGPPPRSTTVAAPASPPPTSPSTSAELLETDRTDAVAPRDFRVGMLHIVDLRTASKQAAADSLERFMKAVVGGAAPEKLLAADNRDRIAKSVEYYRGKGALPSRFRIGELRTIAPGEILANVRLFAAKGAADGEVYLVETGDGWQVEDLQVGFALLLEPYEAPAEPFVPSSYQYDAQRSGEDGG